MEFISFLIYPVILLAPFALYALFPWVWERHRFSFYVCAFLPIALFAALRGTTGTDTENYREAYDAFDLANFQLVSVDPIFNSLIAFSKTLGFGFQGFALLHASLCLVFYAYGGSKLDKVVPLFGLLLLPVLFIDSTFNGLRYGLAFGLATVALHFYMTSLSRARALFLVAPLAAHSSLSVFLFLVPGLLAAAVPLLLLISFEDFIYFSYFAGKTDSYSEFARPGIFSGLMPLLQFATLLIICRVNKIKWHPGFNVQTLAFAVLGAGLVSSVFSYAGLRVLQLAVFIFAVFVARNVTQSKRRTTMAIVIVMGLLSVANFLRQVFLVGPEGGVVFHPYEFFLA